MDKSDAVVQCVIFLPRLTNQFVAMGQITQHHDIKHFEN